MVILIDQSSVYYIHTVLNEFSSSTELLLKDFINELQEVIDWFYLGMCLDVPLPTLLTIKKDLRNTDECRTRMLEAWMNQEEEPTWSKIVAALREMKKTALAEQIASKFGGSVLKSSLSSLCTVRLHCYGTHSNSHPRKAKKVTSFLCTKQERYCRERGFVAICKSFLRKIWGCGIRWRHKQAICKVFSVKIVFSTNLQLKVLAI